MTPAGHVSMAYLAGRAVGGCVAGAILGGLWPDVDYLLLPLEGFNELHRTATHSLLFVAAGALLASILTRKVRLGFVLSFLLGGVLHLAVDACLDTNPTNGIGVALLWPFSERLFSPFNLAAPGQNPVGWADGPIAWKWVWTGGVFELFFCLAAVVVFLGGRRKARRGPVGPRRDTQTARGESMQGDTPRRHREGPG